MSGANTPNSSSRFVSQNTSAEDQLKSQTVGLVQLSDFRKRRAEVLEQSQRDRTIGSGAATPVGSASGTSTPLGVGRDGTSSPQPPFKKKVKKAGKIKLSFGDDEEDSESTAGSITKPSAGARSKSNTPNPRPASTSTSIQNAAANDEDDITISIPRKRLAANPNLTAPAPKAMTKSALLRDAQTREQLRKEYLAMQEIVKESEIIVPFVFYDGTNIPGGKCRMKKGDHIWLFLDRARKVGAETGASGNVDGQRKGGWARVSVDDLILVKGEIIIPHHYDFHYFLLNKNLSFSGDRIFPYASEPTKDALTNEPRDDSSRSPSPSTYNPLARPSQTATTTNATPTIPDSEVEGYNDDPTLTKVVDRRWYERNKHIFPASVWEEFDPTKEYHKSVRTDRDGNKFFF